MLIDFIYMYFCKNIILELFLYKMLVIPQEQLKRHDMIFTTIIRRGYQTSS